MLVFDEARRPAVHEEQRYGTRIAPPIMQKVQPVSVDGRAEVGHPVQGRTALSPILTWRAAASAVSSGRVLKAIAAFGAALWMMFTTVSNTPSFSVES